MAKIVLKDCCLNSMLFEEVVAVYCLDRLLKDAVFQVNISVWSSVCLFTIAVSAGPSRRWGDPNLRIGVRPRFEFLVAK